MPFVDVTPTSLNHADRRIYELADDTLQKIRLWDEVSVEDRNQLSVRLGEAMCQRSRLETGAGFAAQMLDVHSVCPQPAHDASHSMRGVVGRVVEHLNLESVLGVIECRRRQDHALGDVALVVERQLYGDRGQLLCARCFPVQMTDMATILTCQMESVATERSQQERRYEVQRNES